MFSPPRLTNGSVEGERLVGAHAAALRNVSYTLRAADQIEVRALANATAFTYRGILGLRFVQAYAVGDTLYRLEPTGEDDYRIERERYRPGARLDRQFGASLVAAAWLEDRMRWFEYTHVETFAINFLPGGQDLAGVASLVLLVAFLLVKPEGLFGRGAAE